jgi:hypothetical protein
LDEKNEMLEPENYYEGYQQSVDNLKNNPDLVEFDKLCHLVFMNPNGKQLLEEIEKRYLIPCLASPASPNYETLVIFTEGFKDAFRTILHCVKAHEQRIKAENEPI